MPDIISVRYRSEGKQYFFDPRGLTCRPGDGVIVETASGVEYATCVRGNFELPESELTNPLRPVVRLATQDDEETVRRNRQKEAYAFKVCQEKIAEHKLEMKLVSVECSFEGTKILFFFTSEGRVDFRGLVKSLAAVFHTRIELRQIGIRDEAKMLGGLGICGRPFCCSSFLRDFQPVSIKMAKTQNLSLNPTKISGTCGRLMCCLKYEQEAYEDLMKDAPRMDSFVETPDGAGTIISVNTLREKVRVRLDDAPDSLKTYPNGEIRVIRSGKGKRPEGYVQPPKEELEKLRHGSESPEDQYRREQAELAAALDATASARHRLSALPAAAAGPPAAAAAAGAAPSSRRSPLSPPRARSSPVRPATAAAATSRAAQRPSRGALPLRPRPRRSRPPLARARRRRARPAAVIAADAAGPAAAAVSPRARSPVRRRRSRRPPVPPPGRVAPARAASPAGIGTAGVENEHIVMDRAHVLRDAGSFLSVGGLWVSCRSSLADGAERPRRSKE